MRAEGSGTNDRRRTKLLQPVRRRFCVVWQEGAKKLLGKRLRGVDCLPLKC